MKTQLVFSIILLFALFIECGRQETEQTSYTVETIEGVRHVHNHAPQWGDEAKVALEFVQKIGALEATEENFIMYNISDVVRDSDGNIYILDSGDCRIQRFDSQGNYITTIGRKGEGPGEFRSPDNLNLDHEGQIYVSDGRKFIVFNNVGKEIRRFSIDRIRGAGSRCRILPGNKLIFGGSFQEVGWISDYERIKDERIGYYNLFHIIDDDGITLYSFGEMDIYKNKDVGSCLVNANAHFDVDRNGNIYIAYRYRNRIEKRDSEGNVLIVFDRPINFEETGFLFDWALHNYSNAISTCVAVDKKDRVWIITLVEQPEEWLEEDESYLRQAVKKSEAVFEIYSSDGILLGTLPLPEDIFLFRIFDDRLLIVDSDQVGVSEYKIVEK